MNRSQATVIRQVGGKAGNVSKYDLILVSASLALLLTGLVMVASASITLADNLYENPLYFFRRQLFSALIGLSAAMIILRIPLSFWQQISALFLVIGLVFLVAVLIPGVGKEVNGSMRWIDLGPLNIQGSEIVKVCLVLYLAGYMVRHQHKLRTSFSGFIYPIIVVTLAACLLLLEPDYGAAVVLFATALGMLFMGGVPLSRFFMWVLTASIALFSVAVLSPYRLQRLTSFMDPWQDPFNTGFQLTQALIAFGRGDWFGAGLGSSVQKLFYLPEAHTDFIFAVFAEEFGLVGVVLLILLYLLIVWRAFVAGETAQQGGRVFSAYLAYGTGLILAIQAFVNIGVNMGVLPTKGLTLPLISYGNNSMVISCVLIALLIRVEMENRMSRRVPASRASGSKVDAHD